MEIFVRSIVAMQRPFSLPVDEYNRTAYSVNFRCYVRGTPPRWEEFFASLSDGLIDIDSEFVSIGYSTQLPSPDALSNSDGPFITLIDTGGMEPEQTHNGEVTDRITIQILTRSLYQEAARDLANNIYKTMHGLRNTVVDWP